MRFLRLVIVTILFWSIFVETAMARDPIFYKSTRGLGMGGAHISAVNDETTVLINPAALGKLRGKYLTVLDFEVEANAETHDLVGFDFLRGVDPKVVLDDLNSEPETIYHLKSQVLLSYAMRNFSFGFYGNAVTDASMDVAQTLPFEIDYKNDFAFVLGFNRRFMEGRFKIGANVRAINRNELKGSFLNFNPNLSVRNDGAEGIGVASDIGIQIAAPWKALPTLSAVLRDVGGTRYSIDGFKDTVADPEDTEMSLDVGFALYPISHNYSRFTITAEYRDLLSDNELKNSMARYHVGFEWNSYDWFFLRGGMNQGYWTAGIELAFSKFQLQIASFGEEVGDEIEKEESRNFILKFTTRF